MDSIQLDTVVQQLSSLITYWGLRVLGAIVVLFTGRAIARRARNGIRHVFERREADPTLVPFVSGLLYWMAIGLVLIAVLGLFGIPTASFVAVLGAAGLAVGLALQGTLSNFAAGVMLLLFRPFRVGDFVGAGGVEGKVKEIGIFSTILDTPDNIRVVVPNAEVFGNVIRNYTGNEVRRIDLVVGVGYDDDLAAAREALAGAVGDTDGILADPEPVIEVHSLGDSSVNFVVRPWCATPDYWKIRWDLTRRVKERVEAAGCSIPFPQRDVHLFQEGSTAA